MLIRLNVVKDVKDVAYNCINNIVKDNKTKRGLKRDINKELRRQRKELNNILKQTVRDLRTEFKNQIASGIVDELVEKYERA